MSHQTPPRVTIGIPCYNEEPFILDALNSALNQTYANIEIVVSDAGSQDQTLALLKPFESWRNIKILSHPSGTSKFDNWSAMIEASSGDYILILLAKHVLYPKGIESLVCPVIRHPERRFSYIRGCMMWRSPDGKLDRRLPSQLGGIKSSQDEVARLLTGNTCETISTLYQIESLRQAMPLDTDFERSFVWLLNARLASCNPIYFKNVDVGEWVDRETFDQVNKKTQLFINEIPALFNRFEQLCLGIGCDVNVRRYEKKWLEHRNVDVKVEPVDIRYILKVGFKTLVFRGFSMVLGR